MDSISQWAQSHNETEVLYYVTIKEKIQETCYKSYAEWITMYLYSVLYKGAFKEKFFDMQLD